MQKKDLTERLAKEAHLPQAIAADELDDAIHSVLRNMRNPEKAKPSPLLRLIREAESQIKQRRAKR
jgi:hypothetical protein